MIRRRTFTAGLAAALAAPSIARGAANAALKFIPQSDLTILDPIATTVYTARNHGYMVFDTLFGMDSQYQMQPQMVDGVSVEDDGKRWKLTLRDGLLWHDGEKVLARDCVASLRRWAVRDGIGSLLMARTDELAAIDDKTIQFRLNKPFRQLPYALGHISTPMCAMMPERFAKMDPFKAVPEMVGSGPFRFKADEWISGSLAVYTKFDRYRPRQEISTGWTDGGKVWSVLATTRPFPAALAVDPRDPRMLYIGSGNGVEQSRDGGATWRLFNRGLYARGLNQLLFDPGDPSRLYAGTAAAGVFVFDLTP